MKIWKTQGKETTQENIIKRENPGKYKEKRKRRKFEEKIQENIRKSQGKDGKGKSDQ